MEVGWDRADPMNVLLLSMPDSFEHTPTLTMRMPNGALASLAGNLDGHHRVAIADLVLAQQAVPETVARLVASEAPDVVGLSVMTFQRQTALRVIALVRRLLMPLASDGETVDMILACCVIAPPSGHAKWSF